ncbi:hypothetical protein AMAG_06710 [Allomyces macrogynus ATCC 38327]|uniref:Uncharacterized protein n=1 Tax=Allomyces macrogynus (strain ATCC 38327) TaxID=578462 RepID=A0A0L0SET4_ALLM3|nr:hypothetical protein AMAG_06710 [Allomyces macrogynus ATCC 38327]|eukprot:KNE60949.1 hypothetical protein AMAG_06710 [Allomyces macrogynus ATCC 38327]
MTSTLKLYDSLPEIAPEEVLYQVPSHVSGERTFNSVRADTGAVYSDSNRTIKFRIPGVGSKAIDPSSMLFFFDHTATSSNNQIVMDEGAFSPIHTVRFMDQSGVTLFETREYARLHAALLDVTVNTSQRMNLFHLGMGPQSTRPATGRKYACHLKDLFDTKTLIYPAMFGCLYLEITLRPDAEWHVTSAGGTQSTGVQYTLNNCELRWEDIELSPAVNQVLLKKWSSDGIKHYYKGWTYHGQTIGPGQNTVVINNRNKSQSTLLIALQDAAVASSQTVTTVSKTYDRTHAGVTLIQFKIGNAVYPNKPIKSSVESWALLNLAFNHNVRGVISMQGYAVDGNQFLLALNLDVVRSAMSGNSSGVVSNLPIEVMIELPSNAPQTNFHSWVAHDRVIVASANGTTVIH